MLYKTHNKLFNGLYRYKIVIVIPGAGLFRGGDMAATLKKLNAINVDDTWYTIDEADVKYAKVLCNTLSMMKGYEVRVESPRVSIYTNNLSDINYIANLNVDRVKYISKPPADVVLEEGVIVLANRDYDYKVTIGRLTSAQDAFIEWCDANADKIMLTAGCRRALNKPSSFGGTYFYITGDKTLLMAKMHLGSAITNIDKIIKK